MISNISSITGNWKRLTKRWRCHYCPRKDDRKTTVRCIRCTNSICPNHRETMYQCGVCENKPIAETLDFPQETDSCHECPPGGNKVAARCITCFKSVCCMHRSELPHCVKCPALEQQGDEKSS
ncbi:hypothetical protein B566_EDAN012662 [Ephemera danica]|nr:hypothetical protein B566_EDAN012662 [Ephemera danica]